MKEGHVYGSGSVFWSNPRRRWVAVRSVEGKKVRREARTAEEAERKLDTFLANRKRGRTDGLRAHSRRLRALDYIEKVLIQAEVDGWTRTQTAEVLASQLSPRRIKRGIFGPCAYCGTWMAGTIDHILSTYDGGTDDPANLASACWSCNSRKGRRDAQMYSNSVNNPHAPVVIDWGVPRDP